MIAPDQPILSRISGLSLAGFLKLVRDELAFAADEVQAAQRQYINKFGLAQKSHWMRIFYQPIMKWRGELFKHLSKEMQNSAADQSHCSSVIVLPSAASF